MGFGGAFGPVFRPAFDRGAGPSRDWWEPGGTFTAAEAMQRLMPAAPAGKASGGGTTLVAFRDRADTKARISATVDESGNRTAVTVDGA